MATVVDDVVVGFEDTIRQPVVAHELPDVLDRVEFWTPGRQRHERDVPRHDQFGRSVPSGLIEQATACASGATWKAISSRCMLIASLLHLGMTMPAALPSAGQIAPKIHAEDRR